MRRTVTSMSQDVQQLSATAKPTKKQTIQTFIQHTNNFKAKENFIMEIIANNTTIFVSLIETTTIKELFE